MKRPLLLLVALTLALAHVPRLEAQDAPVTAESLAPPITTTPSIDYPQVTCTTSDTIGCADILQLAGDTREKLASVLNLGPTWRFAVHIHVLTPDDPLTAKIDREAAAVFAQGTTMKLEAVLPSTDPDAREFIQRQFVTALLWEKFFANQTSFDKHTRLDIVPLWLVEGLRESLSDDSDHDRESIVRHAVEKGTAPHLKDLTGWHDLSTDRLLGLWQRAFCYYLVESLTQKGARLDDFQTWLDGFSKPASDSNPSAIHFPTEEAWQRELVDASKRSHDLVYTWDETQDELTADETITFAASKDAPVQTCTLDALATLPETPAATEALHERVFILTDLELRAHPSWHSILELYRSALTVLIGDPQSDLAKKLLGEAHRQRVAETEKHEKLLDYLNWFEVTKDNAIDSSPFRHYFSTAQEMKRIQADPAHPNPIRADLLEIESEL
jgi:hypothetical protein